MSDPFVGEIRMFAGNFAPKSWAFCDGQLLSVSQNDALFSLLGTVYGGDGRTTFGIPDMRGRIPLHQGTGPGLSTRRLGSKPGSERVTLTTNQLPSHMHDLVASTASADSVAPQGKVIAESALPFRYLTGGSAAETITLNSQSVANTGGAQSHTNLMPALCINYIIALVGIYPSRQ